MTSSPVQALEVEARPALELLIGLSAATSPGVAHGESWVPAPSEWSDGLREAVGHAGERSGEAWLHLLGLALELPSTDARAFAEGVARLDPIELRRHLVGVYVPAWVSLVGASSLERAATGDRRAIAKLLAHPRYYASRAADALPPLLKIPPEKTKQRVVAVLRRFSSEVFAPREQEIMAPIVDAAAAARELAATTPTLQALIEKVTRGYLYEAEPELDRMVLVPHIAARPLLLLCQHRDARVICYPVARGAARSGGLPRRADGPARPSPRRRAPGRHPAAARGRGRDARRARRRGRTCKVDRPPPSRAAARGGAGRAPR